jgi:hypothetical protein
LENNQNINPSYCATVLDTPAAGPHVYSLRTVPGVYNGSWVFGEAAGPILTFVELAGAVGPKGEPGVGVGTTQVQNSITLGAITTAPAVAKRTVERIESQTIGDKVRLTYKLGQVSAAAGSGHYLLSLPTGMSFNQTYNPVWTANEWQGGVNALAPYHIPAMGGIVIDGNWSNQVMVVPYDSTRFRVLFSNNNSQTTYGFWHSGWYATSAASGISLNLQFEIWK